jgi:type I restriction enzyme S subunit
MTHGSPQIALGELVLPVSTCNPETGMSEADFRYIDLSSVNQQTKTIELDRRVQVADTPSRARQLIKAGDVLVSTVRPNLNAVAVVPNRLDGAIASTGFCVLRPNPELLRSEYLFHWVRTESFISEMVRRATGASYPAVSDRIVCESAIPLPQIEEQRRIAAILDKADALRQKRRTALQKLDSLTQSLFIDIFGDPATNPKGWSQASLGAVCDVRDGTHDSPKYIDKGFPLVTSKNLTGGRVDVSSVSFISEFDYEAINRRSKVDRGDILMPMIGTIGSPVIVRDEPKFAIKNVALIKFRPGSPLNCFIHAYLSSEYFERQIEDGNRGGTQKFISLGDIRAIRIPLPPMPLQKSFEALLRSYSVCFESMMTSAFKIDSICAAFQHRAFRGEL